MIEQLKNSPIIPVFFHPDPEYARDIVQACYAGGLRFFEFTNRGPEAFDVFRGLAPVVHQECPGMFLGIGTIYTQAEATQFLQAGADFVVQPVTTPAVGAACREHNKPWIPGALTANEIWAASQAGADMVKIFPGNAVGPAYVRALRGPMPDVPLMVTGGVEPTLDSIRQWLDAGAQAVGIGSQLFKEPYSTDFSALTRYISALLEGLPA